MPACCSYLLQHERNSFRTVTIMVDSGLGGGGRSWGVHPSKHAAVASQYMYSPAEQMDNKTGIFLFLFFCFCFVQCRPPKSDRIINFLIAVASTEEEEEGFHTRPTQILLSSRERFLFHLSLRCMGELHVCACSKVSWPCRSVGCSLSQAGQ